MRREKLMRKNAMIRLHRPVAIAFSRIICYNGFRKPLNPMLRTDEKEKNMARAVNLHKERTAESSRL